LASVHTRVETVVHDGRRCGVRSDGRSRRPGAPRRRLCACPLSTRIRAIYRPRTACRAAG